jgi:O-acetyl-ADP-ribose deacetylase (regulator of RNase III)
MTDDEHPASASTWTNESVRALAGDADPLPIVVGHARKLLLAALDAGLKGPPVDPFELADLAGIKLSPRADVVDAKIMAAGASGPTIGPLSGLLATATPLVIEYNPTRPRGRLRYSVAHELAHALFPDVAEAVRHRTGMGAVQGFSGTDAWQLELLCNVIAAELLMPLEAVEGLLDIDPDIDFLMANRARLDVSTEALLRRVVGGTHRQLALVAASRLADDVGAPLRVEYVLRSAAYAPAIGRGWVLPPEGPLAVPTGVGQTARGQAKLAGELVNAQAVGIPAYPGRYFPRVLALLEPADAPATSPRGLRFRSGSITDVHSDGPVVIGHIVNDSAHAWGRRGVAAALARAYPQAAAAFRAWTIADTDNLRLGNIHLVEVEQDHQIWIASMVAQSGFGPSKEPRLAYHALANALESIAGVASRLEASVHLPRIGAGQAGGRWDLIEQELDRTLVQAGVDVTIYTPTIGGAGGRK